MQASRCGKRLAERAVTKTVLAAPDLMFTLEPLLRSAECDTLCARADEQGFQKSSVSGGGHGRTGREDARTNSHALIIDPALAATLWARVSPHLQPDLAHVKEIYGLRNPYFHSKTLGAEWTPVDVCERLRVYRYSCGEEFPEHIDYKMGRNIIKADGRQYRQQSFTSLLVYLNDDFVGGTTNFWLGHDGIHCRFLRDHEDKPPSHVVTPCKGLALLMDQNILHEGAALEGGTKYILRTDVIHERVHLGPATDDALARVAAKQKDIREAQPKGDIGTPLAVGEWERIFESSCKNYAD